MKPSFSVIKNQSSINLIKYKQKIHKKKKNNNNLAENLILNQELLKSYDKLKNESNELNKKLINILDKEVVDLLEKHGEPKSPLEKQDFVEQISPIPLLHNNEITFFKTKLDNEIEMCEVPQEFKENEVKNKV